ncbi:MAG: LamG domain-containing protein, partial [Fibromonadales bacterium]|nr:LamG domain-containing protein [Fibromonadales bacterium]
MFSTKSRYKNIAIEYKRDSKYGFRDEPASLEVWAVLLNNYENKTYKDAKAAIKDIGSELVPVWSAIVDIPNPEHIGDTLISIRNMTYVGGISFGKETFISIPIYSNSDQVYYEKDDRCDPEYSMDKAKDAPCSKNGLASKDYDPNKNLFVLTATPGGNDTTFRTDYGSIGISSCIEDDAYRKISINLNLRIPDEYWDAPFGYDNLVNRTIRLDQTNKTMYGKDGYLKALQHDTVEVSAKDSIFYDGTNWHPNYTYGMLTPFEAHRIPFASVSKLSSNNVFAFPDETSNQKYQYPSYYHIKSYNYDSKFLAAVKIPQGWIPAAVLSPGMDSTSTEMVLPHGEVDIFVGVSVNATSESLRKDAVQISYPADTNWLEALGKRVKICDNFENNSWLEETADEAGCKKFYETDLIHHEAADVCEKSYSFKSSDYDSENDRFYLRTNCAPYIKGVNAEYTPRVLNIADSLYEGSKQDTLFIKAPAWDSAFVSEQRSYPEHDSPILLQAGNIFKNEWVKKLKISNARATHLDSSEHTHFKASPETDSLIKVTVKDSISAIRPSEFIAVKGSVPKSANWKLSYLNRGSLHTIAQKKTDSVFEWFDVNRLQGNTSILLQWGGENNWLNIRKLDLDIGSSVNMAGGTVQSLFGEVSVKFPRNAMDTIVTVRTIDAKEHAFTTSNGSALVGPVIEVLPSKEFPETLDTFPRVKARITKLDLQKMELSPDDVRLYKVDTKNKKFVELENTLRGFDKEPDCPGNLLYTKCPGYNDSWSYLMISAETRTFSLFAVLDSSTARRLNEEPESKPDTIPSQIICAIIPQDTLWLGLDNGYLEMLQECNQLVMGTLQLRKNSNIVAERSEISTRPMRWDGYIGLNKIPNGEYSSRYIALSPLGSETQTLGPAVLTDSARPQIINWKVEEYSELLSRVFEIGAKVKDKESGVKSIVLKWSLGGVADSVSLIADSAGSLSYKIILNKNRLSQCLGCKLKISFAAEDFGHNYAEKEWTSGNLYPYPTDLALWYPALEGSGKTAHEYTNTGHDLDLLMQTPWLSAAGIYFEKSEDNAPGKGQVNLGSTDSYTLEAWVNPGHVASSVWRRVLGFNSAAGRRIELQVNGKDVRLLDGSEAWAVSNLLQQPKTWTHLIVAVNADNANFYVDGKLAGTVLAAPSERIWQGKFSLGTEENVPSFTGHIMQVRFYKRALAAEEAQALFNGMGSGESSYAEITLAGDLNWKTDGVSRGFSCAVPKSSYWEIAKESSVSWKAWAEKIGSYKIFVYARSAQPGVKIVKAGVSGALASGTVSLESVWRSAALQEISLPLKAGFNDIELRFPAGMDVAGIAISDNPGLLPSQISWKPENITANTATVTAQVNFEGTSDPKTIRPRIRLQNIGQSTIYGPKVRYYFRGEDPSQVQAAKYYPQEGTLSVRQEGENLGYAEWSFPETTTLPAGQLLFWGEGPHFGLNNTGYVPWVLEDDIPEIIVLDMENRLLSGSCFENERPLETTPVVQVTARDSRAGDNQASQLYIKLENI